MYICIYFELNIAIHVADVSFGSIIGRKLLRAERHLSPQLRLICAPPPIYSLEDHFLLWRMLFDLCFSP